MEDPLIYVINEQMCSFMKKLLGKFVSVSAIKAAPDITEVEYRDNQLPDNGLFVGIITRQLLKKLEDEGDITATERRKFYQAVREFYITAVEYALKNLPLKDEVLENAHFLNFQTRETSLFSQVEFFVTRYPSLLPFSTVTELNKQEEEFLEYQLLERSHIPESVWESALVVEGESQYYRADELWAYMNTMKCGDGMLKFPRLSEVAKLALVLPHSNAEEERVFSMVTKNKTNFRPSLRLDGTLCSIITVKLANPEPCMDYEPPPTILETAKKATVTYNQAHRRKTQ